MSHDYLRLPANRVRGPSLRFSLSTLLLVLTVLCLALGWIFRSQQVPVEALVNVRSIMVGDTDVRQAEAAILKSTSVLQVAIDDRRCRNLRMVSDQSNPVEWLQNRIQVHLLPNTELMAVSLSVTKDEMVQATVMLNVVLDSYVVASHTLRHEKDEKMIQAKLAEHHLLIGDLWSLLNESGIRKDESELLSENISPDHDHVEGIKLQLARLRTEIEVLKRRRLARPNIIRYARFVAEVES